MNSSFALTDRVAVVTGSASGLGRAIAVGLARHGATVVAADINAVGLEETTSAIHALGRPALALTFDVTDQLQVQSLFEKAVKRFGRVDILVNDAFVPTQQAKPQDLRVEEWNRVLGVNLTGYLLCAQQAAKHMIQQGTGGSIVNLSSITGSLAVGRGMLAYSVSKAGINQLTRELAIEWAQHRIRVNAIQPCQIRTPALERLLDSEANSGDDLLNRFLSGIPLGRLGVPDDVVGPVVFLASDAAAMVTGVMLPVDGGNLAMNAGATPRW
ncbi:MAG: SDR family NAD(P)-dependent oxidoreductase [Candidatus Dormibacteraceae bacterium]